VNPCHKASGHASTNLEVNPPTPLPLKKNISSASNFDILLRFLLISKFDPVADFVLKTRFFSGNKVNIVKRSTLVPGSMIKF
jgi:hypothetical protein